MSKPALTWRSAFQKRRYARGMALVEERLTAVATAYPGELGEACRATLAAGGKRVRPLLTLLCARRDAVLGEPVLRGAARRDRGRRRGPGSPCAAARSP